MCALDVCGGIYQSVKRFSCVTFFFVTALFLFGCAGSWLLRRLLSSCGEWGLLFFAMCRLLSAEVLLLQSKGCGTRAAVVDARGLVFGAPRLRAQTQ